MTNFLLFVDLSIPGLTLSYILLGLIAVLIVAIVLVRNQMAKNATSGELTAKFADSPKRSPLDGRNKYAPVDVLRKSGTVFNIGLISSLALAVLAFSWTSYPDEIFIPDDAMEIDEDIEQEPPRTAEPPPPPPPPPPPVIEEVPEEEILEEDEPIFEDTELTVDEEFDAPEEEPVEDEPEVEEIVEEPEEEKIFKVVEDMPRFPGCEGKGKSKKELKECSDAEMLKFIYSNIKYPAVARENGIEGRAILKFMVDQQGNVSKVQVLRDPGGGTGKEAERVVKMMNGMGQKWVPGKQRGKPVKVWFTLPVSFKLQG